MPFTAFETITAAKLNRIQSVTYEGIATSTLSTSTTVADIVGATVTLSTTAANAIYVVNATFDCFISAVSGVTTIQGRLDVDGVNAGREAVFAGSATGERGTVQQQWRGTLAAAGSHTLKLRGLKSAAVGTYQIISGSTIIGITITEVI